MSVYPFIEAEKAQQHHVKRACELLEVSRSAYYAHRTGPCEHDRQDAELTEQIITVYDASDGTYGAPRVHKELRDLGHRHSRKRIARLMRQADRRGRTPKRWRTTTIPNPVGAAARPDLIGRDFRVAPEKINTRWCGDITYINTWEGWLYLATVIDLASRRVIGWATADNLRTDLVAKALSKAVTTRRPTAQVIFHSDRGCQYTSAQYARLADQLGVRLSVGRKGQCWDNAVAESFFATNKAELLDRRAWPTRAAAEQAIFEWIEGWYNTRRRHSTLDYLSPATYEATAYTTTPTLKVA